MPLVWGFGNAKYFPKAPSIRMSETPAASPNTGKTEEVQSATDGAEAIVPTNFPETQDPLSTEHGLNHIGLQIMV